MGLLVVKLQVSGIVDAQGQNATAVSVQGFAVNRGCFPEGVGHSDPLGHQN
jgi:hypothetical protein